jgi:hypothetical protein
VLCCRIHNVYRLLSKNLILRFPLKEKLFVFMLVDSKRRTSLYACTVESYKTVTAKGRPGKIYITLYTIYNFVALYLINYVWWGKYVSLSGLQELINSIGHMRANIFCLSALLAVYMYRECGLVANKLLCKPGGILCTFLFPGNWNCERTKVFK